MDAGAWHSRPPGMIVPTGQQAQGLDAQPMQGHSGQGLGDGGGRDDGRGGGAAGAVGGAGGVAHSVRDTGLSEQHGATAVQESVNRLSGLSVNHQGGFGNLAIGGGGQAVHGDAGMLGDGAGSLPPHLQASSQRGHHKMMGGQQFAKGQGLAGMRPHDTDYAEQLLSELAWAQGGAPQGHGQMGTPSAHDSIQIGGGMHAPAQHSPYDFAGLKRDAGLAQPGGLLPPQQQRLPYGSGGMGTGQMVMGTNVGAAAHDAAGGIIGNVGGKRSRAMMVGSGALDHHALVAGRMGHPSQGGAHQDALMELARENLVLKHQLQVASLELTRLRGMCEKYQHEAEESSDNSKTNQSRYWTDDEHQRFLDAIQKFGHKDVKAIASFVGSRNATQVRTHAQKYFMRLARSSKQACDGSKKSDSHNGGSASEIDAADDLPPLSSLRAGTCARALCTPLFCPPRHLACVASLPA
jgi:SHAQKYF class myb-like DNA-binding protein